MNQQYPSTLLEKAVGEFSKLPGIGRKTAMRLVLHLLRQDTSVVEAFGSSIITLKHEVKYCKVCHNISDTETCQICANPQRVYGLRSGEYTGCDGCRGHSTISWVVPCFGGGDFTDGWGRTGRSADRKSGAPGSRRGNK